MGYAACLKEEKSKVRLSIRNKAYIYQNTLYVSMLQLALIIMLNYHVYASKNLEIHNLSKFKLITTRFIASIMMHFNVKKDVWKGIQMMKYAVNHPDNFDQVHPAFLVAFLSTV